MMCGWQYLLTFVVCEAIWIDCQIVFPENKPIVFKPITRVNAVPKCGSGYSDTYCEDYVEYPERHIEKLLQENTNMTDFFGVDVDLKIRNRIGDDDEMNLCSLTEMTIYPQLAKNKNDQWRVVVNQGNSDKFKQGILIEKCTRENQSCDGRLKIASGYTTFCKQKMTFRKLLSLSDTGEIVPDLFPMPSTCCCVYKRDF